MINDYKIFGEKKKDTDGKTEKKSQKEDVLCLKKKAKKKPVKEIKAREIKGRK